MMTMMIMTPQEQQQQQQEWQLLMEPLPLRADSSQLAFRNNANTATTTEPDNNDDDNDDDWWFDQMVHQVTSSNATTIPIPSMTWQPQPEESATVISLDNSTTTATGHNKSHQAPVSSPLIDSLCGGMDSSTTSSNSSSSSNSTVSSASSTGAPEWQTAVHQAQQQQQQQDSGRTASPTSSQPLLDKPKRCLSAYNLFFQAQRKQLVDRKLGFAQLARVISQQWKATNSQDRQPYVQLAQIDAQRYQREMQAWKQQAAQLTTTSGPVLSNLFSNNNNNTQQQQQDLLEGLQPLFWTPPTTTTAP